jgi:tubulin polyglutamylase TTLL6/13
MLQVFLKIILDTQYDVVLEVCEDVLGWKIMFEKELKEWDLYWTDSSVSTEMLLKMKSHQKINHFPGMSTLSRKNTLAKNMRKMQ